MHSPWVVARHQISVVPKIKMLRKTLLSFIKLGTKSTIEIEYFNSFNPCAFLILEGTYLNENCIRESLICN